MLRFKVKYWSLKDRTEPQNQGSYSQERDIQPGHKHVAPSTEPEAESIGLQVLFRFITGFGMVNQKHHMDTALVPTTERGVPQCTSLG